MKYFISERIIPNLVLSLPQQLLQSRQCLRLCTIANPLKKRQLSLPFLGFSLISCTRSYLQERPKAGARFIFLLLYQTLCYHCFSNFYKASNVCACLVVNIFTINKTKSLSCVKTVVVNVTHDAVKFSVNFCSRPRKSF